MLINCTLSKSQLNRLEERHFNMLSTEGETLHSNL